MLYILALSATGATGFLCTSLTCTARELFFLMWTVPNSPVMLSLASACTLTRCAHFSTHRSATTTPWQYTHCPAPRNHPLVSDCIFLDARFTSQADALERHTHTASGTQVRVAAVARMRICKACVCENTHIDAFATCQRLPICLHIAQMTNRKRSRTNRFVALFGSICARGACVLLEVHTLLTAFC